MRYHIFDHDTRYIEAFMRQGETLEIEDVWIDNIAPVEPYKWSSEEAVKWEVARFADRMVVLSGQGAGEGEHAQGHGTLILYTGSDLDSDPSVMTLHVSPEQLEQLQPARYTIRIMVQAVDAPEDLITTHTGILHITPMHA